MTALNFQKNYFQLFDLPQDFELDRQALGERFRHLQGQLHPDRFTGQSATEQRIAVQYSALVNEAYTILRKPLSRALYLLQLAGIEAEEVASQRLDGGFLMEQMEHREKLESINDLVDPETVLAHLMAEIATDTQTHMREFQQALNAENLVDAARACVKIQYLEKLNEEAEQVEAGFFS
ncbi:UNVERIFIED_CONTAM: hypothetical protein GTU68_034948 [Idotea baltica]|nr:hypothetical protein [Idotea baltica]